jgi:hypothetical protein
MDTYEQIYMYKNTLNTYVYIYINICVYIYTYIYTYINTIHIYTYPHQLFQIVRQYSQGH